MVFYNGYVIKDIHIIIEYKNHVRRNGILTKTDSKYVTNLKKRLTKTANYVRIIPLNKDISNMMEKFKKLTIFILAIYCIPNADAKTLIIPNNIMKKCIFDNRTMSFEKCLWSKGTFKNDSSAPTPTEPPTPDTPPTEPPEESDNPTPPEPEEPPVTPPSPPNPSMPAAGASATGTANANNGPAAGNEDPEKEACIAAGSEWKNNAWVVNEPSCETHSGGGNRWGAVWNHQTMKYDCLNAKEWVDFRFEHGDLTVEQKEQLYEWFLGFLYDKNGNTTPQNTDLQWYKYKSPNSFKCASLNERQCYESGGSFWWGPLDTGTCYTHATDKPKCEAIGAKFTTRNGISSCDCKIKNTDMEFHWKTTGSCDWKQGNRTVYGSGAYSNFFEYCLKNDLKDSPIFNGSLYTITGGLFNPHQVPKTLNCE